MPIRLHDSLTRELRELTPAHLDGIFRFYNCGPTVYAPAHIGNFRTFVVNDVLRRLLELEFGPDKVKHVRNLTDVDDKTIRRAREEDRPLGDVTRQWTEKFHADCAALNCLPPHAEPRATDPRFLKEQVNMIEVLMEKGNAYRAPDGSVYFKVSSFDNYGRLSRVKERELQPGSALKAAAADADEKEDGSDFALWKAWKPDDGPNKWTGPRGAAEGRPGWHIECSAMSKAILGETIDLHTGGVDLLFPHHENEIAQSECCNGVPFSRHWYHSEHLLVDGKKMSKSLGNLYTLDDLKAKGFSPMAVRYALLRASPRQQLNFTLNALNDANNELKSLLSRTEEFIKKGGIMPEEFRMLINSSTQPARGFSDVLAWLNQDMQMPRAIGALFTQLSSAMENKTIVDELLGWDNFKLENKSDFALAATNLARIFFALGLLDPNSKTEIPSAITALAEKRWAAKKAKDFAGADALRKELTAAGWAMLDGKDGYKLEPVKK